MRKSQKETKLSVVVLNYNTKDLLFNCLNSIIKISDEVKMKIVVVDNGSTDGSVEMLRKFQISNVKCQIVENKENLGFAAGNNKARKYVSGDYVLFLNSDTEVRKGVFKEVVKYLDAHRGVGALTCKLVMPNGKLDLDVRRSFPTPWVALTHFAYLDRLFPRSKIFAKYWYGFLDEDRTHEIDVLQGAFCMVRKSVLDKINWYDETYFLDGEDVDLSWKIKKAGYKIIYYPKVWILHIKGATKGKQKAKRNVKFFDRIRYVLRGVNSMEIFYRKHLWKKYSLLVNYLVIFAIWLKKIQRVIAVTLSYLFDH